MRSHSVNIIPIPFTQCTKKKKNVLKEKSVQTSMMTNKGARENNKRNLQLARDHVSHATNKTP